MKNFKLAHIFGAIIFALALTSCKSTANSQKLSTPLVINPTYRIYDTHGERGYQVSFKLSPHSLRPVAIVLNQVMQPLTAIDIVEGSTYRLNIITATRLRGHQVKTYNSLPSGLIYYHNGTYYLRPVHFKLKP